MIVKPNRPGQRIGEVYEVRLVSTRQRIMVEREHPEEPGLTVREPMWVDKTNHGRLVWDGSEWQPENIWLARARAKLVARQERTAAKPKTVLRKARG